MFAGSQDCSIFLHVPCMAPLYLYAIITLVPYNQLIEAELKYTTLFRIFFFNIWNFTLPFTPLPIYRFLLISYNEMD